MQAAAQLHRTVVTKDEDMAVRSVKQAAKPIVGGNLLEVRRVAAGSAALRPAPYIAGVNPPGAGIGECPQLVAERFAQRVVLDDLGENDDRVVMTGVLKLTGRDREFPGFRCAGPLRELFIGEQILEESAPLFIGRGRRLNVTETAGGARFHESLVELAGLG
jgi:hypothetical protein